MTPLVIPAGSVRLALESADAVPPRPDRTTVDHRHSIREAGRAVTQLIGA